MTREPGSPVAPPKVGPLVRLPHPVIDAPLDRTTDDEEERLLVVAIAEA